ncbi:MAG: SPOR domain-containing protein [Magnetococcales bacterium]|nr:SPOR domain-containing protein [Magnetococcales bacterium]
MNEDLLELKRNIIQYHSNAASFVDDDILSEEDGDANSIIEEQLDLYSTDANLVADKNYEDKSVKSAPILISEVDDEIDEKPVARTPVANIVADQKMEDQPTPIEIVTNEVIEQKVDEKTAHHIPVANIVAAAMESEQPANPTPIASVVTDNIVEEQPVNTTPLASDTISNNTKDLNVSAESIYPDPIAKIAVEPKIKAYPVSSEHVSNIVAEPKVVTDAVHIDPVSNIVAETKVKAEPVYSEPVTNIVADHVQADPVASVVAEPKIVENHDQNDLVAKIIAKQRVEKQALGADPVDNLVVESKIKERAAQLNTIEEELTSALSANEVIDEQEYFSTIDSELANEDNFADISAPSNQNPSSGELMGTGLRLLWCGCTGAVRRMGKGFKYLLSSLWRGNKNLFFMIITTRRPLMELVVAIPVAMFIGYQFQGFNNSGKVNVPLTKTYSKIQIVQPDVKPVVQTYVKDEPYKTSPKQVAIVPDESQQGIALIRDELIEKLVAWRDRVLDKIAALQEKSDITQAKYIENSSKDSDLLVVVKPPKNPMEMYQSHFSTEIPIAIPEKKTTNTQPFYDKPLQIAPPVQAAVEPPVNVLEVPSVQEVASSPVKTFEAPPVKMVADTPVKADNVLPYKVVEASADQDIVEQPVKVALKKPTQAVKVYSSQMITPQPMKAKVKRVVSSAMVAPMPLKKGGASKFTQKWVKPNLVIPDPVQKARVNFIKKRRVAKNSVQKHLQANNISKKGFVLFLGSYRQSKAEYLDSITDNLKQEPFDLIKQTVEINEASYTRLYAGPFASRKAADLAKKALFASKKIDSSITYLQPGVTQYSRIEKSGSKSKYVKKSTRNSFAKSKKLDKYAIRVGSFQNVGIDSSGNLLRKIAALGGVGFQQGVKVKGKTYWRVYSGPFANLQQVNKAKDTLEKNLSLPNMAVMSKNSANRWVRVAKANRS